MKAQFKRREPERVYLAVVYGHPDPQTGEWRDHLVWDEKALIQKQTHPRDPDAQEAISSYRVLQCFKDASLIEVRLQSGRRNQIRIQARLRGHTLVGEKRYTFGPDACGRSSSSGTRCTPGAWRSSTRPTAAACSSRRLSRRTLPH